MSLIDAFLALVHPALAGLTLGYIITVKSLLITWFKPFRFWLLF